MGNDLHSKKAAEIFGIPESEVTPEQRRFAKTGNYSNLYSGSKSLESLEGATTTGDSSCPQGESCGIEPFQPEWVTSHRGYEIWQHGETSFRAAGARHGSCWSAICYIDELLSP